MKTIAMIIAIVFYILAVVIIVGLIARSIKKKATVTATLIKKHETSFDSISHHNPNGSEHIYVLTFRTEDGEELVLKTSYWIYGTLDEGDVCTVTYKGSVITEIHGDFENINTETAESDSEISEQAPDEAVSPSSPEDSEVRADNAGNTDTPEA